MWCKYCEKESFSERCEICGEATETDVPTMVYWCDECNVPLIHKATDRNKGTCSLCGKVTNYLCADLRPVFPEERLLYEILTAKPFQYKDCSVWVNNNRYYINGKVKVFSMAAHEKKDAELHAKCNLGWYYEYGLDCEPNIYLAQKYYELSAKQGFEDAIKYLKRVTKKSC